MSHPAALNGTKRRAAMIATAGLLVAAGLYAGHRYLHGDTSAPLYVVPDSWRANLLVEDRDCRVALEYKVKVLKADAKEKPMVPLFPEGTVFGEMRLNDDAIVPVKHGGWVCARIRRPGDHSISCRIDVKVSEQEGVSSCKLQKAKFVSSSVQVDSGRALEVRIAGTPQVLVGTADAGTHGLLHAGLMQDVTVTWQRPRPAAVREGVVTVKPSVVWSVKEKVLAADAVLDVSITGGTRDHLAFSVPDGISRIEIRSEVVADWELKGNVLKMFFGRQVGGALKIDFGCEVARKESQRAVCPSIAVEDGHLASGGYIVIVNDTPGVMLESFTGGLEPVADIDIPADVRGKVKGKPLFVYREIGRASEPAFDVVTKDLFPMVDTIADKAEILTVLYSGGEEVTRAIYSIRNNGKQFLRMAMPEGYTMLSVSVDNSERRVSSKDGLLLVPLADSIQTLGGLVPFPVEIIYCRQAEGPRFGRKSRIDLPELPDVPVASVRAKVLFPDELRIKGYRSLLRETDEKRFREGLSLWASLPAGGARQGDFIEDAWLFNNYWSGYRAYRENRVEDAEEFLEKAVASGRTDSDIVAISEGLLKNIKAGRGELTGQDKLEKAKISAIKGSLATMNEQIEAQQSQLVDMGLANLDAGDEELGAELLKEADKLGAQIGNRGGSKLRQSALRRKYKEKLKDVEDERRRKLELQDKLRRLQKEARDLAARAPDEAQKLGKGLVDAAYEENLAPEQVALSDIAWGNEDVQQELSAGVEAKTMKDRVVSSGAAAPALTARRQGGGLKEDNAALGKKVSVLEKALSYAKSKVTSEISWGSRDTGYVRQSIENKKKALSGLKGRVSGSNNRQIAANDYYESRRELEQIKDQVAASKQSFQGIGSDLDADIETLEQEVAEIEASMLEQEQVLQASDTVQLTITNLLPGASMNTIKSFNDYLNYNYASQRDGQQLILQGDVIEISNAAGEVTRVTELLEKFGDNKGNAARFSGRKVDVDVNSMPALQGWFSNRASNGNPYAILDEAQYNTLLFAEANNPANQPGAEKSDSRDIIVGTPNPVLGKEVTLARADADSNGIVVDGSDVELAHDEYYAVVEDGAVTVIRAGAARNWQDDAPELRLDAELPFKIEVPERGRGIFFEKTLLAAGECSDIELTFEG